MKTLQQIEPRTPISSAPFTITQPGSYYLTTNLTVGSGDAITISASGVTLDLNGFTIRSTASSATGTAIVLHGSPPQNITIMNGHIRGGVTNNGGTYSGSGFAYGIQHSFHQPRSVLVSRLSISGCLVAGINLFNDSVVESCTVTSIGSYGVSAATVRQTVVTDCGSSAISANQVSDSHAESSGDGAAIAAGNVVNSTGRSSGSGHGVAGTTVLNSYGRSNSGNGVNATVAENSFGESSNGIGLFANYVATNSLGISNSGRGLVTTAATNCFGQTDTGDMALLAIGTASTSRGWQTDGIGTAINAGIAIGCTTAGGTITGQKFLGTP